MTHNFAISLDDRVDLEQWAVESMAKVKTLAMESFKLFRHQIPGGADRGPDAFTPVNSQMVAVPFYTVPTNQTHPSQGDDSYNQTAHSKSESD